MKKLLRRRFFVGITIGLYFTSLYFGFWANKISYFFILLLSVFIFFHFFVIELKHHIKPRGFFLISLGLTAFTSFVIGFDNLFLLISVCLYNLGLFFLYYSKYDALLNSVNISNWDVVHNGAYTFTVFFTLTLASLLLGISQSFPLTCDKIYSYSENAIEKVKNQFGFDTKKTVEIKEKVNETKQKTVAEILGLENFLNKKTDNIQEFPQNELQPEKKKKGIFQRVEKQKNRLFDSVIKNSKDVNKKVCSYLVEKINNLFSHPAFKFSAMALIFILLSPFLRILIYIIEIVLYLMMQFLILIKVYKFGKRTVEAEDLV